LTYSYASDVYQHFLPTKPFDMTFPFSVKVVGILKLYNFMSKLAKRNVYSNSKLNENVNSVNSIKPTVELS